MKKVFQCVILFVFSFMLLHAQDYDIRKLNWGMSFEDVKRIENLGDDFFKQEQLLGTKVEVDFGFDYKGLYSVIYSTRTKEFGDEVEKLLREKYGEPTTGIDYSFLMLSASLLKQYPEEAVAAYEKNDLSLLESIKNTDERKIIWNALAKQNVWHYGNTTALLLNSPDVIRLSYWSNNHQIESKKKFASLLEELKKKIQDIKKNRATEDVEKF